MSKVNLSAAIDLPEHGSSDPSDLEILTGSYH